MTSFDAIEMIDKPICLFSHGLCPVDAKTLAEGIENRKIYLQTLLDSDNKATAEEAVANCSRPFHFLHWRASV